MDRLTKSYADGTHGASDTLPFGENSYDYKNALIERLGKFEDLQEQLEKTYGDCDGILETIIDSLVKHDGADIGNPIKARLLIDNTAEKWMRWKTADEHGRLLELPCKVGYRVYEIYRFCGYGAWEIDVHKIKLEDLPNIGKTVFLTREEAEKALEEKAK